MQEIQDRENLIKRDFKAEKPLQKLLSDITEIQCCDGKMYVSASLDCYNGEILSVAMDSNMKKELCIRTVFNVCGLLCLNDKRFADAFHDGCGHKTINIFCRLLLQGV